MRETDDEAIEAQGRADHRDPARTGGRSEDGGRLPQVTAIVIYAILSMQGDGFRFLELLIGSFVLLIGACYVGEVAIVPTDWPAVLHHSIVPRIGDSHSLMLAAAIVGATVMPHAIYLHSSLTQNRVAIRHAAERHWLIRWCRFETVIALGIAGLINMAMVVMAAAVFHDGVHDNTASIETAY